MSTASCMQGGHALFITTGLSIGVFLDQCAFVNVRYFHCRLYVCSLPITLPSTSRAAFLSALYDIRNWQESDVGTIYSKLLLHIDHGRIWQLMQVSLCSSCKVNNNNIVSGGTCAKISSLNRTISSILHVIWLYGRQHSFSLSQSR